MKKLIFTVLIFLVLFISPYAAANENYQPSFRVKLTYYCPKAKGINGNNKYTAFMSKPSNKTVAISRSLYKKGIRPGTKLQIEGIGIRVVEDLMGKRVKGDQIDICIDNLKAAKKLGVKKNVLIHILEKE